MTLLRLIGGTLGVAARYGICALAARRNTHDPGRLTFGVDAIEALGLTLFAALWFGSLGHGGWWLLFAVIGLLVEGPIRWRHRAEIPTVGAAWRPMLLGTLRTFGAGAVLSLLL